MVTWRVWTLVIALGLAAGVTAWVGSAVAWDLYQDHQRVHAIWDLELRRAQATQAPAGN